MNQRKDDAGEKSLLLIKDKKMKKCEVYIN